MISKEILIPEVISRLKRLQVGGSLDLRPYKRNRSVLIMKTAEDEYRIVEDGFFRDEAVGGVEKIAKLLKPLIKKEFPRSHKVRIYTGAVEE